MKGSSCAAVHQVTVLGAWPSSVTLFPCGNSDSASSEESVIVQPVGILRETQQLGQALSSLPAGQPHPHSHAS